MARSNYTAQQLIASVPVNSNVTACASWYADCMRWADIEREEDIKTDAWKALKELNSLCARQEAIDVLLGKLRAYIKIYLTEQDTPFDPTPDEPNYSTAVHTFNPTFPSNGTAAGDPVLPTKQGIN